MAMIDPAKATVTLPDDYLIAIGKVCVQWGMLESMIELAITKLAGFELYDPRSKIMVNHMAWPMRVDIFSSLCHALATDYPRLKDFAEVLPLMKKAQEGRNRIVHGFWGCEDGKVTALRASARGRLKVSMESVTLAELNGVLKDINVATAGIYNLVIGT